MQNTNMEIQNNHADMQSKNAYRVKNDQNKWRFKVKNIKKEPESNYVEMQNDSKERGLAHMCSQRCRGLFSSERPGNSRLIIHPRSQQFPLRRANLSCCRIQFYWHSTGSSSFSELWWHSIYATNPPTQTHKQGCQQCTALQIHRAPSLLAPTYNCVCQTQQVNTFQRLQF